MSFPADKYNKGGYVLVLKDVSAAIGFLVDGVQDIQNISLRDIQSTKETDTARLGEFIQGHTKDQIFILDGVLLLKMSLNSNGSPQ